MALLKARGIVKFAKRKEDDGEQTLLLEITEEVANKIREVGGIDEKIDNPIKLGSDVDAGKFFLKVHSKYPVSIYRDGEIDEDTTFAEIGQGSEVAVAFTIKDGKYKNKKYQSAYLKSINIFDFVEAVECNPWVVDESSTAASTDTKPEKPAKGAK